MLQMANQSRWLHPLLCKSGFGKGQIASPEPQLHVIFCIIAQICSSMLEFHWLSVVLAVKGKCQNSTASLKYIPRGVTFFTERRGTRVIMQTA